MPMDAWDESERVTLNCFNCGRDTWGKGAFFCTDCGERTCLSCGSQALHSPCPSPSKAGAKLFEDEARRLSEPDGKED